MVILNDRIPIGGHDRATVLRQLKKLAPESVLLDFQRPGVQETADMASMLAEALDCPVGVSERYAGALDCPVFVSPPPPDTPLEEYLSPWSGREIWLEAALGAMVWRVTEQGAEALSLAEFPEDGRRDEGLFCHYRISPADGWVDFQLWRTRADLDALLEKAQTLGMKRAIGLWQELGR